METAGVITTAVSLINWPLIAMDARNLKIYSVRYKVQSRAALAGHWDADQQRRGPKGWLGEDNGIPETKGTPSLVSRLSHPLAAVTQRAGESVTVRSTQSDYW